MTTFTDLPTIEGRRIWELTLGDRFQDVRIITSVHTYLSKQFHAWVRECVLPRMIPGALLHMEISS